jgi:hypothetical protein
MGRDAAVLRPRQHRPAREFRPVVRDERLREATRCGELVEEPSDPDARDRRVGERCEALTAEVVHEGEDAEASALLEAIHDEVHRPALVASRRT